MKQGTEEDERERPNGENLSIAIDGMYLGANKAAVSWICAAIHTVTGLPS